MFLNRKDKNAPPIPCEQCGSEMGFFANGLINGKTVCTECYRSHLKEKKMRKRFRK